MEVFDREGALKAFGRPAILQASITVYMDELGGMKNRLEQSMSSVAEMEETAHWIKGAVSYMHAPASRACAERLEGLCKSGAGPAELKPVADELCHELDRLGEALRASP